MHWAKDTATEAGRQPCSLLRAWAQRVLLVPRLSTIDLHLYCFIRCGVCILRSHRAEEYIPILHIHVPNEALVPRQCDCRVDSRRYRESALSFVTYLLKQAMPKHCYGSGSYLLKVVLFWYSCELPWTTPRTAVAGCGYSSSIAVRDSPH